jgi:hypothetical protein
MRINEIASSEEQLALWKLISDNIWTAISQQAETERRQRAEAAAKQKLKPKNGGKRGGRKSLPPPPPFTPPPPPKSPPPPQAKNEVGREPTQQIGGGMKQQQVSAANSQQPNALPTQKKAVGTAQQSHLANPQAALADKDGAETQVGQPQLLSPKMRLMRQYARNVAKSTADKKSL